MIVHPRHRPMHLPPWRRWRPRQLALLNIRSEVDRETKFHPAGSPTARALGRASRALWTAVQEEGE